MKYSLEFAILTNKYASGNRTVKQSGGSMHLHVDSEHTAGATATEGFSLYVGPWMTVNQDRRYTKHIYAGSQRIVSKVGDVSSFSSSTDDPRGVPYVGKDEATRVDSIGTRAKYAVQTARVGGLYAKFGVPYGGRDNNVYPDEVPEPAPERSAGSLPAWETGRFFHHPDHLGSSSRVTDRNGKVVQAVEYVPFGEVFLDLRNSDWGTPYLFNAKELDGETGLYYYGARYYDPRLCLWLSADPLSILSTANSSYRYCRSNPVNLTDPTGLFDTKSEAQKYAGDNFPQAGVLMDTKSGKWFVSLNEDATDSYSTGPVLTRYFGPYNPYKTPSYPLNSVISAFGIANGTKSELLKMAFKKPDEVLSLIRYHSVFKYLGNVGAWANIIYTGNSIYDYYSHGGSDAWVYGKYFLDISFSIAAMTITGYPLGPIVLTASALYFMLDLATDGFGLDYTTPEPFTRKEDDN